MSGLRSQNRGSWANNDVGHDSSLWSVQAALGGSALGILYSAECRLVICWHIPGRPWFECDALVVYEGICRETIELCELGEERSSCARDVAESAEHVTGQDVFVDVAVVPHETPGNRDGHSAIQHTPQLSGRTRDSRFPSHGPGLPRVVQGRLTARRGVRI